MDVLEAINSRRSIRKFTGKPIDEQDLKNIIKAGFQAPSAHGLEPREFVVVRNAKIIEKIVQFHGHAKMLPQAGCGIVVCGDKTKQDVFGFLISDCSASVQNMLLAVHGLGLGAVWCGIYPREHLIEGMADVLNLPEHIIPVGMVVVGIKDEEKSAIDRYNEGKIHYDRW
ncbi:MAG: nitroreductase family protein [Natronincolaceae bacterium]|jgi:nitroreductase